MGFKGGKLPKHLFGLFFVRLEVVLKLGDFQPALQFPVLRGDGLVDVFGLGTHSGLRKKALHLLFQLGADVEFECHKQSLN